MGSLKRLTKPQISALRLVAKGYASVMIWTCGTPQYEIHCPGANRNTIDSLVKRGYVAIGSGRMPLKHRYSVHNVVLTKNGKMAVIAAAKERLR